jgi:hypothetical protein
MIYGPGGYKYNDFVYIGTPMQIVLWILTVVLLATTTTSNFYISWVATLAALLLVVVSSSCENLFSIRGKKALPANTTADSDQSP